MSFTSLLPSRSSDPEPGAPTRDTLWERLDRPDSAALHGLMSGAVWFVIGTLLGLVMSDELTTPDIFAGIAQLVFSRLRPAHINIVLFGFLSTAFFGAWYFIVPRLCKTPLRSNRAANILLVLWNLGVLVGALAVMWGDTKGKEYAEYPMYIDWPILILMGVNAVIIFRRSPPGGSRSCTFRSGTSAAALSGSP